MTITPFINFRMPKPLYFLNTNVKNIHRIEEIIILYQSGKNLNGFNKLYNLIEIKMFKTNQNGN